MAENFNGATPDYLTAAPPVVGEPCTVSAGFYVTALALQTLVGILDTGGGGLGGFMLMAGAGGNVLARTKSVAGNSQAASSTTFAANTWNIGTGVYAAANDRRAFLAGAGKGTNAVSRSAAGIDTLGIGAQVEAAISNPTSGMIDHVAVWNIALADAEVALLATYTPDMVRRDALVFYAKLINGEMVDVIGGLALTAVGAPTVVARADGLIYPQPQDVLRPSWQMNGPLGRRAASPFLAPVYVPLLNPSLLNTRLPPWMTAGERIETMAFEH